MCYITTEKLMGSALPHAYRWIIGVGLCDNCKLEWRDCVACMQGWIVTIIQYCSIEVNINPYKTITIILAIILSTIYSYYNYSDEKLSWWRYQSIAVSITDLLRKQRRKKIRPYNIVHIYLYYSPAGLML